MEILEVADLQTANTIEDFSLEKQVNKINDLTGGGGLNGN